MKLFRTALTPMLLVVALDLPLEAQQFSGTLRGTVQDSTGAVVQGAEVSVVESPSRKTASKLRPWIRRAAPNSGCDEAAVPIA
jgi:hypothetical protein